MQAGSWGFVLPIQTDEDLTNSTAFTLMIIPPADSGLPRITRVLDQTAIGSPATSGIVNYTVQPSDFQVPGDYVLELIDTTPGRNIPMRPIRIYVEPSP